MLQQGLSSGFACVVLLRGTRSRPRRENGKTINKKHTSIFLLHGRVVKLIKAPSRKKGAMHVVGIEGDPPEKRVHKQSLILLLSFFPARMVEKRLTTLGEKNSIF